MEEPPCQRITAKSWETSGRRHGPPVTPRLQKIRPHGRAFFGEGEHGGEVQAHVGCAKGEDGMGLEEVGEEAGN